jgi:hypothetical protein
MIQEIRKYFSDVISEIDPDLRAHSQAKSSSLIPDTTLENSYMLDIGNLDSSREDTTINGFFTVILSLWKNGYNNPIENYDKAYCKAIDIQALAMLQSNIDQTESIKSVVSGGITTELEQDNDNLYKFTIQFSVRVDYYYKK